MKPGDEIEWRGVNRIHRARVTESENGELLATLENGKAFPLSFILDRHKSTRKDEVRRD